MHKTEVFKSTKEKRDNHDGHRYKPASKCKCDLLVSIEPCESYWKALPFPSDYWLTKHANNN